MQIRITTHSFSLKVFMMWKSVVHIKGVGGSCVNIEKKLQTLKDVWRGRGFQTLFDNLTSSLLEAY